MLCCLQRSRETKRLRTLKKLKRKANGACASLYELGVARGLCERFRGRRGHNRDQLFLLARAVKDLEIQVARKATREELLLIFNRWYELSLTEVKQEEGRDSYFFKFLDSYYGAKYA